MPKKAHFPRVNKVRWRDELYYYHRPTGIKLPSDYGSAEFAKAWAAAEGRRGKPGSADYQESVAPGRIRSMTTTYAKGTKASISKTDDEIKKALRKYGAENFLIGEASGRAQVLFEMNGKRIIMRMPLPARNDKRFVKTSGRGLARSESAALALWEQEGREKWRALLLCIKAKLESVSSGVETFEQAFLAHMLLPSGETVSEWAERPDNKAALEGGRMPPLLGAPD